MKRRLRDFMVKLFSLTLAITMCIPTNVYAISMSKRPKEMPTSIRIADAGEENNLSYIDDNQAYMENDQSYIEDNQSYVENYPVYEEANPQMPENQSAMGADQNPQIPEEDRTNYTISQKARLNNKKDAIIYEIKVEKKQASYHNPDSKMNLSLATYNSQALKDIKLTKVLLDGKEIKATENQASEDNLKTKSITTPSIEKEITYTLEGAIDEKAIDSKKLYSFDLSLNLGQTNLDLQRISYKFMEYQKEDNPEVKELRLTHIKENEDELRTITYKKEDQDDKADEVTYTDYIISKDKADEESRILEKNKIEYKLSLGNIKAENTEIALDYYKANEKGFAIQKEFSTKIPYQEKLDLDVPASYILKITVRSKVNKKDTKIEKYAINSREVKSPRFVKEEEKSSDDEEAASKKAEEEKKAAEEKAKAEEAEQKANEQRALEEKKSEEERLAEEERLDKEKEASEEKAKLEAEKKTQEEKADSAKKDEAQQSQNFKALMAKAPSKEEKATAQDEVKEDSKLAQADSELKAALADKTKGIEEIQNLLTSLGEKYKLSRDDQEKLMTANDAAIKALVEKDRKENFRPLNLREGESNSFDKKVFNLKATMDAKASLINPIPTGYYFDIKLGPYLQKNPNYELKDLYDGEGNLIATAGYYENGDDHYIRYTYVKRITSDVRLTIDQNLAFVPKKIGDKEQITIQIKAAPKNNPVQSMKDIVVKKTDPSPVSTDFTIKDQEEIKSGTYPYQLNWRTSQKLKNSNGDDITDPTKEQTLEGAYVEWDIEVDTDKLIDPNNPLEFGNLNLTVFGSSNQVLKNISYRFASDENGMATAPAQSTSDLGELLTGNSSIAKGELGQKLYIKVRGEIDPNQLHESYSIGFRINPDKNYIDKLVNDILEKYNNIPLPPPLKWLRGVKDAKRFAEVPFNLVETNIPATFNGLSDRFNNERFYYDNTRTIFANRIDDNKVDWYALDLIRRGETQDPALDNPSFYINNPKREKKDVTTTKVYFVPLKDGGYRKSYQPADAILSNGQYYPGTIISYEYKTQKAGRNDTYYLRADLKEKRKFNVDGSYQTEGGRVDLFTEKISDQALANGYLAYTENPYPIMRINRNFDMVSCFNDNVAAPVYEGTNKGVFLDIHEDPSGTYLISRLNESIAKDHSGYKLRDYLNGNNPYDGVNLNHNGLNESQAMEELMKKIYFYGEEVKKEYAASNANKEEMHRLIEASMYQRVIHHFTDNKALTEDYFDVPSDYNVEEWKVDYTLTGRRTTDKEVKFEGAFDGTKRKHSSGARLLKDKETRIKDYPPVQRTQLEMANKLYKKVIDSYKDGNTWNDDKADSVKLVFYSHTDEGKYQELLAGRVMAPIEIDKYKKDGSKLEGAVFTFTNINTGQSKTWKSTKGTESHKLYLRPGSYRVQETTTPEGYEKIKDFDIKVQREEINGDDGPYKFKKLPKIHVNDGFKTKVVLGDDLPKGADGKALVTIDNGNIKVSVTNIENNLGSLEFTKMNKFVKLDGAEFALTKLKTDSSKTEEENIATAKAKINTPEYDENVYRKTSKGEGGDFKFEQIPEGIYILEEINAPKGYQKANKYILQAKKETVDAIEKVLVNFIDKDDDNLKEVDGKNIITNQTKKTEVKFRKLRREYLADTTNNHLGLADAKFRLMSIKTIDGDFYLEEAYTDNTKPTETTKEKVDNQQAEGGGYVSFKNLTVGEYLLQELEAPKGYKKTDLYGWKLVISESEGKFAYKLYEVPKAKEGEDQNKILNSESLTEVKLFNLEDKNKGNFQIGNDARTIDVDFNKYLAKVVTKADGKSEVQKELVNKKLMGADGKAVSFNLYKADYYGAIISKDAQGKPEAINKDPIVQDDNGVFHLKGLEFGKYYVLREVNPPVVGKHPDKKIYAKANDILLKVEAEAIANEGEMKVIVRDPNSNTSFGEHGIFEGVIDFEEGEQLGKFTIKKVGNSIAPYTGKVGLRRAYFRLYTAKDESYEIAKNEAGYPEYIQKVTPGEPIIQYKKNQDGSYALDSEGRKIRIGVDPSTLPKDQGIVTFDNLKPGYYVLEEYRGPAGYEKNTSKWKIYVDKNGNVQKSILEEKKEAQTFRSLSTSSRLKMAGLEFSEINSRLNHGAGNIDAIYKNFTKNYSFDPDVDIAINAEDIDTKTGDRKINISISPKEKANPAPKEEIIGNKIQLVFVIDRSKDTAELTNKKNPSGPTIDKNINKLISDIVQKAKESNAMIDATFIQYDNGGNSIVGGLNQDLIRLDNSITDKITYTMTSPTNPNGESVTIKDYLGKLGVKARVSNNIDGDDLLAKKRDEYYQQITNTNTAYDKRIFIDIANFKSDDAKSFFDKNDGNSKKYQAAEIIWPFRNKDNPVHFDTWMAHIDQYTVLNDEYVSHMANNTANDSKGNILSDHFKYFRNDDQNNNGKGLNISKDFFDKNILTDENFIKERKKVDNTSDSYLVENGEFVFPLTSYLDFVDPSANIGTSTLTPTIEVNNTTSASSLKIDKINLKKEDKLNISFTVKLKNPSREEGYDVRINDDIVFKTSTKEYKISDRIHTKKFTNPVDPGTKADHIVVANFIYRNYKDGKEDSDNPPSTGDAGTITLQYKGENGNWYDRSPSKSAKYSGPVTFTNLNPNLEYRFKYEIYDNLVKEWGLDKERFIPFNIKEADKQTKSLTVDIENGNMLEIFNHDETGFRIPLRVTKVNENRAPLTGSRFHARKIINGDPVPIVDDQGNPTNESAYPKYHDEKFDATSEATGEPGDNYFRELSPGIYEIWEEQTPDLTYRQPLDKDGNPLKWYFKVQVGKDKNGKYKKPSDDNYMEIQFDFEHEFKDTDDWNKNYPEEDKQKLIGKTVKGIKKAIDDKDSQFYQYTEIIPDDGRSKPARPDAPYKGIDDVRVTNYRKKTKLSFFKKDIETHKNLKDAEFTLRKVQTETVTEAGKKVEKVKVDNNNKSIYAEVKTTDDKGKPYTDDQLAELMVQPFDKQKNYALAKSTENLGVEFTNIEEGTYILEEVKAADGYKPTDSFLTITFTEAEDGSWKEVVKGYKKDSNGKYVEMGSTDTFFSKDKDGRLVSIANKKKYINLKFHKIRARKGANEEEIPVNTASFKLTQVDENGKDLPGAKQWNVQANFSSNEFNFTNLGVGRYKLEETKAIDEFEKPDPWFFEVKDDENNPGKLKIEFEKASKSISFTPYGNSNLSPEIDENGNPKDLKIKNYSRINFKFRKLSDQKDANGKQIPLKDAVFRLKKLRYSMEDKAKAYEYYEKKENDQDNSYQDGALKKYSHGDQVTEFYKSGTVQKFTKARKVYEFDENGNLTKVDNKDATEQDKKYVKDKVVPDSVSAATGKYYSTMRSQSDGAVSFGDLGEGIYELTETKIPDGYQSSNKQFSWIFKVEKGADGLEIIHDPAFEKEYYKTFGTEESKKYYKEAYATNSNVKESKANEFSYEITNTKTVTDLKWKKITNFEKEKLIKKRTQFWLFKVSDDPTDPKVAESGQSSFAPYQIESSDGNFEIKDLSKGIYTLVETVTPEGYKEMKRFIVIQIYEDENDGYKLKQNFYEMKRENGKNILLKEPKDFTNLLTQGVTSKEVIVEKTDGTFYVNNEAKPQFFYLSKGFMKNESGKDVFTDISKGELKIKIYADPADTNNKDTKVYERTIKLSDDKSYKIDVDGIKTGVDYLLEEVESPDGFAKTKYKYRLRFAYDASWETPFVATLMAVLDENGQPLKNDKGQNITDSDQFLGDGKSINTGFPFQIVNKKTEIEFTKVGLDGKTETPLKDVEFYLEKQDPSDLKFYPLDEKMELIKSGKTDTAKLYLSDKDGKFKITDLTDGHYRVMEPNTPKDYMEVTGPVKTFRVVAGEVLIADKEDTAKKITETLVTDSNKEKLGKIINRKPGKGEFKVKKYDDLGNAMVGVDFKLEADDASEAKLKTGTTDTNGEIHFTDLPYGYYWLVETKTKDGFIVDTKRRLVSLGGDKKWNVPTKNTDVSDNIKFAETQKDLESTSGNKRTVYPNKEEAILARFKLAFTDPTKIKPGNYFTIKLTDDVDIDGIVKDQNGDGKSDPENLNIIGPAGLLAKAEVAKDRRTITYTFTDYVGEYTPNDMELFLQLYPNRKKLVTNQNLNVRANIGPSQYDKSIDINYRGYQNPTVDVSSYMLRLEPKSKTFTAIIYYNPWNRWLTDKGIEFILDKNVVNDDSLKVTTYKKLDGNGNALAGSHSNGYQKGDLPDSYDLNPDKDKLTKVGEEYTLTKRSLYNVFGDYQTKDYDTIKVPYGYLNKGYAIDSNTTNNDPMDTTYVIEIKGTLTNKDVKSLKTHVQYNHKRNWNQTYYDYYNRPYQRLVGSYYAGAFKTWSQFYTPGASGTASKEMQVTNFRNRIDFVKVDGGVMGEVPDTLPDEKGNTHPSSIFANDTIGDALAGAKFKLKKDGVDLENSEVTSDKLGRFSWVGLAQGFYEVWEIEAPKGYKLPEKMITSFTVDKDGNIKPDVNFKEVIANTKLSEIKIRKVDQDGNPIAGKDKEGKDIDTQAGFNLTRTNKDKVKGWNNPNSYTDKDGYALFEDIPAGNFELKETQTPKGYTNSGKTWKLTVAKDGRIAWTNSFDDTEDVLKTVTYTETGNSGTKLDTKIVGIDKTKKVFRQYNLIKATKDDLKTNKVTITSPDANIKLNAENTRIRLVGLEKDSTLKDLKPVTDEADYKVAYTNNSMEVSIILPEEKAPANKPVGSEPGEKDQKTYLLIVDMPYSEKSKVGASLSYKTENVVKTVDEKDITEGKENHTLTSFKNNDNDYYRPRIVNDLDFVIENIKKPNIYFKKVDAKDKDKGLAGAEFELQKSDGSSLDPQMTATSDKDGNFGFENIPDGTYKVTETKAPTGYALLEKTVYKFKVEKGKIYKLDKSKDQDSKIEELTDNSKDKREIIENQTVNYPYTGGPGNWLGFTIMGLLTMTAAAIYLAMKKKEGLTN